MHAPRIFIRCQKLIWIWVVFLFSSCNYPGISMTSTDQSVNEIRQTLDAISILDTPTDPTPEFNPLGTIPPEATPRQAEYTAPIPGGAPLVGLERIQYFSQPGDTLPALALRFNITQNAIQSSSILPSAGLLPLSRSFGSLTKLEVLHIPKHFYPTWR